jgi:GNAT superfamily N-acetyltransferase
VRGECFFGELSHRADFVRLWGEYLEEHWKMGSPYLPDEHNLRLYREHFDAYTRGEWAGVAVFWHPEEGPPAGIVLAGEERCSPMWHLRDSGTIAVLWGVYVQPAHRGHRVGLQMEAFGRDRLVDLGFTHAVTSVRATNPLGTGNWRHWHHAYGVEALETRILASLAEGE